MVDKAKIEAQVSKKWKILALLFIVLFLLALILAGYYYDLSSYYFNQWGQTIEVAKQSTDLAQRCVDILNGLSN